jgi:NADPH-dependent 2,4-dienoyl-CoA reductase/sulfur reductase-like enzyme/rhodanese-related sulfurtransferase
MEVVIIGGSAAGLKAACRISRLQPDANVRVLVKDKYFATSNCGLPFFLSGDVDDFNKMIETANGTIKDEKYFRDVKDVEVLARHEVIAIDRAARLVRCKIAGAEQETVFPYDKLVIATGSTPVSPAIPGLDSSGVLTFSKAEEAIQLRRELETNQIDKVIIVGGGFIGLELCDAFHSMWGIDVELVDLQNHLLAGVVDVEIARLIEAEVRNHGIKLKLKCGCREIIEDSDKLCIFDNAGDMIKADRIILAAGISPNSSLAKSAGLEIGVTGGIKINNRLQTSDPDIYACGDCVELTSAVDGEAGTWAMGSLASRMGRVVGDNICNGDSKFGPVVGTNVIKVFDLTIGSTGYNSAYFKEQGYETEVCWGTFYDRLHYYPGATPINMKVIYERSNNRVLGFQAITRGQLIPVLTEAAQIIRNGGTLDDFTDIEHAYAPPFSLPFDQLHYMSFIAENSRTARIKLVSPAEFDRLPDNTVILDVRTPSEIQAKPLNVGEKRKIEIPVEQLRNRLNEVKGDGMIVTVCQMGSRAWDAALMLRRKSSSKIGILAGGALFLP